MILKSSDNLKSFLAKRKETKESSYYATSVPLHEDRQDHEMNEESMKILISEIRGLRSDIRNMLSEQQTQVSRQVNETGNIFGVQTPVKAKRPAYSPAPANSNSKKSSIGIGMDGQQVNVLDRAAHILS